MDRTTSKIEKETRTYVLTASELEDAICTWIEQHDPDFVQFRSEACFTYQSTGHDGVRVHSSVKRDVSNETSDIQTTVKLTKEP